MIEPRRWSQSRSARFATAVAERHAVSVVRARATRRVFTRLPRLLVQLGGGRWSLALSVAMRHESRAMRLEKPSSRPRTTNVIQTPARTVSSRAMAPLIERTTRRATRDDGRPAGTRRVGVARTHAIVEPAPSSVIVPPVRRVLRGAVAAVERSATAPVRRDAWLPRTNTAPSLSPTEIGRLTDHIVETIDRRIAAFRERRGRV